MIILLQYWIWHIFIKPVENLRKQVAINICGISLYFYLSCHCNESYGVHEVSKLVPPLLYLYIHTCDLQWWVTCSLFKVAHAASCVEKMLKLELLWASLSIWYMAMVTPAWVARAASSLPVQPHVCSGPSWDSVPLLSGAVECRWDWMGSSRVSEWYISSQFLGGQSMTLPTLQCRVSL